MSSARSRLQFIPPLAPIISAKPPEGGDWIHEVKYDGYRTQLIIEDGKARAFTKTGLDWTAKYGLVVAAAAALPCKNAIIDGEMVVLDEKGVSDFSALPAAIRKDPELLVFVAFDLLYLDGFDRRWDSLHGRRSALWDLVKPATGKIQFSQHVDIEGADFFRAVDAMELEGIISKKAMSKYVSGPSKTWLKTKCFTESEYEVVGLKRQPGKAALALMATPGRAPKYVGAAIIALKGEMRERLLKRVQDKARLAGMENDGVEWVRPGITGVTRHLKGEQKLRHATLTDFRDAKVKVKLDG